MSAQMDPWTDLIDENDRELEEEIARQDREMREGENCELVIPKDDADRARRMMDESNVSVILEWETDAGDRGVSVFGPRASIARLLHETNAKRVESGFYLCSQNDRKG